MFLCTQPNFCSAVRGLIRITLSQVIFVSGLGSSISHPLFAQRPSQMQGSGRNTTSYEPGLVGTGGAAVLAARLPAGGAGRGGSALPATTPSCSDFAHVCSKLGPCIGAWPCQYVRTRSYPLASRFSSSPATTSIAERVPYSG